MATTKTERRQIEVQAGELTVVLHVKDGEVSSVEARHAMASDAVALPMIDAGVFLRVAKVVAQERDELRDYRGICVEHGWLERWTECEVCHPPTPKVVPAMSEAQPS